MKSRILMFLFLFSNSLGATTTALRIYAASSLTNVLNEIVSEFKSHKKIVLNFDASSKLAKQIESGAPADIYFSADTEWMDYLDQNKKIISESKVNLLSNRIVLIVPTDSARIPKNSADLNDPFFHHIALAAETVPLGKFARAALKAEGSFSKLLQKKISNAENARIALSWVAKHEAAAGIVYATDAKIEKKVRIAFMFSETSHPKIIYPVAILKTSSEKLETIKFINFCKSNKAQSIFQKAGFLNL